MRTEERDSPEKPLRRVEQCVDTPALFWVFKVSPQIADSTNRPLISAAGLILRPFGAEAESVKSMDCVRKQAPGEVTHNVVVVCCCWSKLKSR